MARSHLTLVSVGLLVLTLLLLLMSGCTAQSASIAQIPPPNFNGPVVVAPSTPAPALPVKQQPIVTQSNRKPANVSAGIPKSWIPYATARNWRWIVIHHSATPRGGAAAFNRMHQDKGWDELGYHFVIGNGTDTGDGQIEVGPRWGKQKWGAHAKTPDNQFNERGIGICLVGNFDNERPTPAQMASLAKLTTYLMKTYHVRAQDVIGHGETKATDCPGRYINIAAFRRQLAAGLADASKTDGDIAMSLGMPDDQPAAVSATEDGSNP